MSRWLSAGRAAELAGAGGTSASLIAPVAKAISSFANTLGGWLMIGVTDSRANAGTQNGWTPVAPHELVDRIRQVLEGQVDPVPPFAATVFELDGAPIGVVRVYESTDTPHIMRRTSAI